VVANPIRIKKQQLFDPDISNKEKEYKDGTNKE
jgi:hypothetical protein